MPISNRAFLMIGAATLGGLITVPGAPVSAQGRAVVQPIPPAATNDLNRALLRLASNPRDVDALILAGQASLELGDIDAAIGFFGRAEELSPNNPRVKAGTAAAYVRVRRPVEALRLFEEAERAGVRPASVAGDMGLAHDLVGNNREAQGAYRRALAFNDNSEVRRRMALSYAIAGDSEGFESTLLPLLNERDLAAYRTRAFGLAILGKPDEAVAITDSVMPKEMAERIEPYLRYMRRLTPAQQAAAGNLGVFPRASAIGRDDPRIAAAQTAGSSPAIAGVDSGLAPSGLPLGQTSSTQAQPGNAASSASAEREAARAAQRERRRLQRSGDRRIRVARAAPVKSPSVQGPPVQVAAAPAPTPASTPIASTPRTVDSTPARQTERGELPALARADAPSAAAVAASAVPNRDIQLPSGPTPVPAPTAARTPTPVQIARADPAPVLSATGTTNATALGSATAQPPAAPTPETPQPLAEVAIAASSAAPAPTSAPTGGVAPATSAPVTVAAPGPSVAAASPAPGFNLSDLSPQPAETAAGSIQAFPAPAPGPVSVPVSGRLPTPAALPAAAPEQSLTDAFADLLVLPNPATTAPPANAVDITTIEIPRDEVAPDPEPVAAPPKPEPPANASRIWVQVATGRDRSALRFDWRRFARQAPDVLSDNGPYVVSWGQTNRLLSGPYDSRTAANAAITSLAGKGIGAFRFTSEAGQEIARLGN